MNPVAEDRRDPEPGAGPAGQPTGQTATQLEHVPWGAVILYLIVSFGLAWAIALPLWIARPTGLDAQLMTQLTAVGMMFTPAIAVLVMVFGLKVPRGERLRFLGMWPLRPAKRVVWFMVGGVIAPIAIVIASVAVAVSLGWLRLDLVGFSGFAEGIQASLPAETAGALPDIRTLVVVQLALIPIGAVINAIPAFGEELGWRGWLLPALRPLGTWPALILTGAIWGLWHSPLILLGYNFGLYDWRGVAVMTLGCVAWGVLLGWARLRSGSLWPAVLGHGALNAAGGLFALVAASDQDPDFWLVNPLGASGWIVLAVAVAALLLAGQFGREPGLAAGPSRT